MRGNDPQDRLCDCITSLFSLPFCDDFVSQPPGDAYPASPLPHTSRGMGFSALEYPGRRRPHDLEGDYEHRVQLIILGVPTHLQHLIAVGHFSRWIWPRVEDYFAYLQLIHDGERILVPEDVHDSWSAERQSSSESEVQPNSPVVVTPAFPNPTLRRNVVTVVPPHLERVARNFRLRYPSETMESYVQQLERRAALYDDDYDPTPQPCTPQFRRFIIGAVCYSVFVLIACLRVLNMFPFF